MSQRTSLFVGLIMTILGTAVLGADRFVASADYGTGFGNSTTTYTYVGLGILVLAAIWFFASNRKPKSIGKN